MADQIDIKNQRMLHRMQILEELLENSGPFVKGEYMTALKTGDYSYARIRKTGPRFEVFSNEHSLLFTTESARECVKFILDRFW